MVVRLSAGMSDGGDYAGYGEYLDLLVKKKLAGAPVFFTLVVMQSRGTRNLGV